MAGGGTGGEVAPRLLFLGGGAVVAELYLPALLRLGWADGAVVVEARPESIDILRSLVPGLDVRAGDFRDFLADAQFVRDFDGVIIALPNQLHEEAAVACLQAGLPVLCEKPLALTSDACLRLAQAAERAQCSLSVGMVRRFIPAVITIRNALRDGLLGVIESAEIQHGGAFTWPSDTGHYFRRENGGILVNMGIHYLDMLEHWLGELVPVRYEDDWQGGVEANCDYRLSTSAGAPVRLALSYTNQLPNEIVLRGSAGMLRADVNDFAEVVWQSEAGFDGTLRASAPFARADWPHDFISSFAEQLTRFVRAARGQPAELVDARQAAATTRLVDWAYAHRRALYGPPRRVAARPALAPAPTLVTGATGFLGSRLVQRLAELGFDQVKAAIRSHRRLARLATTPAEPVLTNLLDRESVDRAVRGARYVFHLAYGADGPDVTRATVQGTRNVVEAAIAAGAEAVVVVSTATVFGHPRTDQPIDETFPYRPALGEYGKSKTAAERWCLARAKTSATRIVVLNPSAIYGPGGYLFTEFPARGARDGSFVWIENGGGNLNYTFVENVVDALVLAAGNTDAHGERFIINDGVATFRSVIGPLLGAWADRLPSYTRAELIQAERADRPTVRDFMRELSSDRMMSLINRTPVLRGPKRFMEYRLGKLYRQVARVKKQLQAGGPASVAAGAGGPAEGPPGLWLADIFGPIGITYSAQKARTLLGWQPLVSLESGQQACIEWLESLGVGPSSTPGAARVRSR